MVWTRAQWAKQAKEDIEKYQQQAQQLREEFTGMYAQAPLPQDLPSPTDEGKGEAEGAERDLQAFHLEHPHATKHALKNLRKRLKMSLKLKGLKKRTEQVKQQVKQPTKEGRESLARQLEKPARSKQELLAAPHSRLKDKVTRAEVVDDNSAAAEARSKVRALTVEVAAARRQVGISKLFALKNNASSTIKEREQKAMVVQKKKKEKQHPVLVSQASLKGSHATLQALNHNPLHGSRQREAEKKLGQVRHVKASEKGHTTKAREKAAEEVAEDDVMPETRLRTYQSRAQENWSKIKSKAKAKVQHYKNKIKPASWWDKVRGLIAL